MAYYFKVYRKRNGINDKEKYYALGISQGTVNTRKLAEEISQACSLTTADVVAVLSALSETMARRLKDGYRVELDNLGRFSLSATSDGYDTPEECIPGRVRAKKVNFKPEVYFSKSMNSARFERFPERLLSKSKTEE